jgi:hypothetical protein
VQSPHGGTWLFQHFNTSTPIHTHISASTVWHINTPSTLTSASTRITPIHTHINTSTPIHTHISASTLWHINTRPQFHQRVNTLAHQRPHSAIMDQHFGTSITVRACIGFGYIHIHINTSRSTLISTLSAVDKTFVAQYLGHFFSYLR